MNTTCQSNTRASRTKSGLANYAVVFTDSTGVVIEISIIDISLSQCVSKCNRLIETAFSFGFEYVVYIYPINRGDACRDVYRRQYGSAGEYRSIQCNPNKPLTTDYVISAWQSSDNAAKLAK